MTTYELIAKAFRDEGVEVAFGIVGDATLHWYAAMAGTGVEMIATRQEIGAVAMAEGYAHVRGDVGVASVTSGPGLVQAGLALANAARAGAPVVVFAGDAATMTTSGLGVIDQRRFVEACGATFLPVRSPESAVDDVHEAFALARERRTAVVLNVPIDIQLADAPDHVSDGPRHAALGTSPAPASTAGLDDLAELVRLVLQARRPVVLAGRGALDAAPELRGLADQIGAITATTLLAKGLFHDDPFGVGLVGPQSSRVADQLFAEADLVLAFGSTLDRYALQGAAGVPVFPLATAVSINVDPTAPTGSDAVRTVVGDARATAQQLLEELLHRGHHHEGFRSEAVLRAFADDTRPSATAAPGLLHPVAAMEVLERHLTAESHRVVVGSGHFFSWPNMYLRRPSGGRFLYGYCFGSIGLALPIGIGAAIADRSSRVVVVEGDGSMMEIIQELDTAHRAGVLLTVLVLDDEQLGAERFKGAMAGIDPSIAHVKAPAFDLLAHAFGCEGAQVHDAVELDAALSASDLAEVPFLIDARIDPTVLCDMYRKMHFDLPNVSPHQGLVPT